MRHFPSPTRIGIHLSIVCLVLVALLPIGPVFGADPKEGRLSQGHPEVSWTGGPFYASNPLIQDNRCGGVDRSTCDLFVLDVRAQRGWLISVATETSEGTDLALFVYDRRGEFVAGQDRSGGNEMLSFRHDPRTAPYEVRVQPFLVEPGATYQGDARLDRLGIPDAGGEDCLEAVPLKAAESALADDGREIRLDVLVLLDGMKLRVAERVFEKVGQAYSPLGIDLVATFQEVSFTGQDLSALLEESRQITRGERPRGVDVVHTLTAKDVGGGLVLCVGGIRYDGMAYSASQGNFRESVDLGPFKTYVDAPAVIAAHEIGHLLGANHYYGNCFEGLDPQGAQRSEMTPCSVMNDTVIFNSLKFDAVSAAVVRGYALKFADN